MSSPRKSARAVKLTQKMLDLKLSTPKKLFVESSSDESSNSDVDKIVDSVANEVKTPGKDIFSLNKKKKHERVLNDIPKTPHATRLKIKKNIQAAVYNGSSDEEMSPFCDSGSEYSAETNSSAGEVSTDLDEPLQSTSKTRQKVPSPKKSVPPKNRKYVIKTEEYFANTIDKKATTSNHTLDNLDTPRLSQEQLKKLLSKLKLSEEHSVLHTGSSSNFYKWMSLLHEGFNLIVYGLGSKKTILQSFQEELLSNSPVIVVNGFFPSLTIKDILDAILTDLLELPESSSNVYEACDVIAEEFAMLPDQRLYLIVNNIDGEMLRNAKCQNVLTRLASVKNIHLVASIDHINAPLIWDHNKLSKFNFIWWDCTTFLPYSEETSYESSMMVQKSGSLALSSLRNVFLSLTSNSKGIYLKIVNYQLENGSQQYYQGLLFKDLYWTCREAFLVSSDLALRAQLTEFIDHKLVRVRRSADGSEHLVIPIANALLQQFVNEQNVNT